MGHARAAHAFPFLCALPSCWPAAPIAASIAGHEGGDGGAGEIALVAVSGHVITDPTSIAPLAIEQAEGVSALALGDSGDALAAAGPMLSLSAASIDFGATGTRLVVQARNAGSGTINVTGLDYTPIIGPDANWLSSEILSDGKTIALVAIRGTLAPGDYEVQVDVDTDAGQGSFLAFMSVGVATPTPIGPVIVDVLAADQVTMLDRIVTSATDGYAWSFPTLPRGSYFLMAGVDLDSDGLIGEPGEPTGAYPIASAIVPLELDGLASVQVDLRVQ